MNTKNNQFDVGTRIHELRTERKLSQEQLALRSNITPTYLGFIERGLKNPTVKVVEQLCDAMGVSLAEFFSTEQKKTYDSDSYSLQILSQISDCTDEEKDTLLRIIKYILRFKSSDR